MAITDDLVTAYQRQKALRKHQQRGTPQEAMDGDPSYSGATWVIVGYSIQIRLDPAKCADGRVVIVTCPDLGQACMCDLHESGVCQNHDTYTRSRLLLSNVRGITAAIAICDACGPYWVGAQEEKARAAKASRHRLGPTRDSAGDEVAHGSVPIPAGSGLPEGLSGGEALEEVLADLGLLGVNVSGQA